MPRPLRAALYTRVSTDLQANKDEGSLDTQEARLRAALAARATPCEVAHVFREEGESGKSLDRPALQQLLARVRAGDLDLVLVTRIDRLSRSLLDFYEVHRLFEQHGVQFVSLNETFDTSSPVGRAMLKLVLVFAELEREQTAERTRAAMRARAERGLWNGGHPPLGYTSQGNGHLDVDKDEAALVRTIFAQYLELRSTVALARWLTEHGHRQKSYTSRRRGPSGGQPFTVGGLNGMLKNRLYLGEIEHKGEVFEGQHEAIVDRETFDRVQEVIATNHKGAHGPPLRAQYDYLLTGVLRCACGSALTTSAGNGRGGRYHYYRCVGVQKRPGHACPVRQVRAETVDQSVLEVVREAARDPALLAEAVDEANRMAREQVDPLRRRVEQLRRELREAEDQAGRTLQQILAAGVGTSSTARRLLTEAEERQAQLREALTRAEGELATRETEQLDLDVMVEAIRGFDLAFDHLTLAEKREFLQLMLEQVVVHPDRVELTLYEGRSATRYLVGHPRLTREGGGGGGASGSGGAGAGGRGGGRVPGGVPASREKREQDGEPASSRSGFAPVAEWLPLRDRSRNGQIRALAHWRDVRGLQPHPGFGVKRPRPDDAIIAGRARSRGGSDGQAFALAAAPHETDPWWQRRAVLRERLAQAAAWKAWLDAAPDRRQSDLARRQGVSRARVCQVLRLLDLDQEIVRDLELPGGPVPTERALFALASLREPGAQVARYRDIVVEALREDAKAAPGAPIPKPRIQGDVRHLLDRARRYQALLDSKACRSIAAIAEQERVTPTRVGQVLLLLHLHPDILEMLEQPGERAPLVRYHDLLRVARMRDQERQLQAFYGLIAGSEQGVEAK